MTHRPPSEVETNRPPKPRKPWMCVHHRTDGSLCEAPRVKGTEPPTCQAHGASAPQVKAAARRRLAESNVRRSLEKVEVREVENPLAELQALTGEVLAWKDVLASYVAALGDAYRRQDDKGGEQLRAEVELYERALDRAGKFLEMWARLGLDSMLAALKVRVSEQQTKAMLAGLEAYRKAAGVEEAAHQAGLAAMAKAMRS